MVIFHCYVSLPEDTPILKNTRRLDHCGLSQNLAATLGWIKTMIWTSRPASDPKKDLAMTNIQSKNHRYGVKTITWTLDPYIVKHWKRTPQRMFPHHPHPR